MGEDTASHTLGASQGPAARSEATEQTAPMTEVDRVKFECIKNASYNDDRERHFARFHKGIMFVVVLSGTAAFGTIFGKDGSFCAAFFAFVATAAGVADLVFDLDGRARLHNSLKRRSYDLLARLQLGEKPDEICASITRMYADEPPTMHAVNSLAFNAAVDALGRPPGQKYDLEPWQVYARHWWPFRANEFPTLADAAAAKAASSRAV